MASLVRVDRLAVAAGGQLLQGGQADARPQGEDARPRGEPERGIAAARRLLYKRALGEACLRRIPPGHVAEWLRSGLQNRLRRFNSGRGLHYPFKHLSAFPKATRERDSGARH